VARSLGHRVGTQRNISGGEPSETAMDRGNSGADRGARISKSGV